MLVGVGDAEIEVHEVQKIGLGQGDAFGFEITGHIKNQFVGANFQLVMVEQHAIRVAAIVVQGDCFKQFGVFALCCCVQFNVHTRCGATVHGVEYMC